jgi:hypothetical protein
MVEEIFGEARPGKDVYAMLCQVFLQGVKSAGAFPGRRDNSLDAGKMPAYHEWQEVPGSYRAGAECSARRLKLAR